MPKSLIEMIHINGEWDFMMKMINLKVTKKWNSYWSFFRSGARMKKKNKRTEPFEMEFTFYTNVIAWKFHLADKSTVKSSLFHFMKSKLFLFFFFSSNVNFHLWLIQQIDVHLIYFNFGNFFRPQILNSKPEIDV